MLSSTQEQSLTGKTVEVTNMLEALVEQQPRPVAVQPPTIWD